MTPPQDFIDILAELVEQNCDFVVVGAYALAANGHPRATRDIDILVRPDSENAERVFLALVSFGAPVSAHDVTPADFAAPGNVYQIGLPPVRIDILTSVAGIDFAEAVNECVHGDIGGVAVRFLGLEAQIRNKRAAGRAKDIADVEALEAIRASKV